MSAVQKYLSLSGDEADVNAAIVSILSTGYGVTISLVADVVTPEPPKSKVWPICKPCGLRHLPEVSCEDNFQRKLAARSAAQSPKAKPVKRDKTDKGHEAPMSVPSLVIAPDGDKTDTSQAAPLEGELTQSGRVRKPKPSYKVSEAAKGPRFRRGDTFQVIMTNSQRGIV